MILRNVELHWARLDPNSPDMGFSGDKPQWNVQLRTRSKEQCEEWKKLGMNPQVNDDDDGIFYRVSLRKDALSKDGSANKPVPVVGADVMPLDDVTKIGNGTIANVKVRNFEWKFQGKEGIGFRLEAIQVVKLIEYAGKSEGIGFETLETPEISSTEDAQELY